MIRFTYSIPAYAVVEITAPDRDAADTYVRARLDQIDQAGEIRPEHVDSIHTRCGAAEAELVEEDPANSTHTLEVRGEDGRWHIVGTMEAADDADIWLRSAEKRVVRRAVKADGTVVV